MEYTRKALETQYNGVTLRSRLEAKWAALFDSLGWQWDYEPFDLDGWSPDFLLRIQRPCRLGGVREICLLVEVKPFADSSQFESHPISQWPDGHPSFDGWPGTSKRPACAGFGVSPDVIWLSLLSDSEDSYGPVDFDFLIDQSFVSTEKVRDLWKQVSNEVRWLFTKQGARTNRPVISDTAVKQEPVVIRRRGIR